MAYARFAFDCDVYVYQDTRGGYTCECTPTGQPAFRCATAREMAAHLREHRARGHQVPDDAIEELEGEIDEEPEPR